MEVGRLLRQLLHVAQAVEYDTGELLALAMTALEHGAETEDLLAVAGEMARLGIPGAEELRTRTEAA